jgi:hypothetical protein
MMIDDPEAFNEIERQAKQRKEAVRAALEPYLEVYKNPPRNDTIEEVAQHIEKLKGFGQDTVSGLAIYIREMKRD